MSGDGDNGEENRRAESYRKDRDYEQLLEDINAQVEPLEERGITGEGEPDDPVVFIVGVPRSGSTLLYQILAETGAFGYCSNLMARFYRNPSFGLRVQRLLEPVLPDGSMSWTSEFGRTERWYEPHEFGYFWERHFPFESGHGLAESEEAEISWEQFREDIRRLLSGFGKPVLFKNLTLTFVLEAVAERLDDVRFIRINRDPVALACSLYRVRQQYYGSADEWFSIRPPGAGAKEAESPVDQIVWQIRKIEQALGALKEDTSEGDWTEVRYEELCRHPGQTVGEIGDALGIDVSAAEGRLPDSFEPAGARGPDDVVEAFGSHFGDGAR